MSSLIQQVKVLTRGVKKIQLIRTGNRRASWTPSLSSTISLTKTGGSFLLTLCLFLMMQGFSSCSSKEKVVKAATTAAPLITYAKEKTRGNRLPLYSIEILDGVEAIRYTGIANVPEIGEQIIPLESSTYKRIVKAYQESDFLKLQSVYKTKMRDLPLTTLSYKDHRVTYQEEACPTELRGLVDMVEALYPIQ